MKKREKRTPDLEREVLAGTTPETDQEHEERLDRYGKAKEHQTTVAEYLQHLPQYRKEYRALLDCGAWLVFRFWYIQKVYRLISGCSCKKHLLCALCALRRAARQVMEYGRKIMQVMEDEPHLVPVLITRTIKNGPDLKERYDHLNAAHKKMMDKRRNSMRKNSRYKLSVMRHVAGGAGSYEFKLGSNSGEWHPHSHEIALLDSREYKFVALPRKNKKIVEEDGTVRWIKEDVMVPVAFEQALMDEWLEATGDSFMVDVRRIEVTGETENGVVNPGLHKGVCEAFKYALKMTGLEVKEQVYAYRILQGRRLVYSYGNLWGVKISDESVDTVEEALKDQPYVDLVYNFAFGKYQFVEATDFGELEGSGLSARKAAGKKGRRVYDPLEIDGKMHDEETVCEFMEKFRGEVPF